jgi:hypothetical protein
LHRDTNGSLGLALNVAEFIKHGDVRKNWRKETKAEDIPCSLHYEHTLVTRPCNCRFFKATLMDMDSEDAVSDD